MADDLERKLELARTRERAARAKVARLRRSLDRSNRRTANQVRYALGAALLALAETGRAEPLVANFQKWLDHYLTRPQDRQILVGTAFDLSHRKAQS